MCMDILYTTSSAQSARELSLRRYSSVTVHRDSRCAMRDGTCSTAKLNTPYYAVRMFL
jgi:hypothetical protein